MPRRRNWPTDDLAERRCSSLAPIKIPECSVLTLPVPPTYIIIIVTVFQKVLPTVLTLIYCSCNQILPCVGPAARRVLMRLQENRVAANKTPQMWKLLTANQVVTLGGSWCCWWEEAEPAPRRQLAANSPPFPSQIFVHFGGEMVTICQLNFGTYDSVFRRVSLSVFTRGPSDRHGNILG